MVDSSAVGKAIERFDSIEHPVEPADSDTTRIIYGPRTAASELDSREYTQRERIGCGIDVLEHHACATTSK
jgi:hypothetical protein